MIESRSISWSDSRSKSRERPLYDPDVALKSCRNCVKGTDNV